MFRTRNVLAVFLAGLALAVLAPAIASGHSGPPSTYHRCTYRLGGGSAWVTFRGTIFAPAGSFDVYYTRIVPAWPFGWSGTWNANGTAFHAPIIIPPGTSHWLPSPAVYTRTGVYTWTVNVRPNPGSFNNYRLDIYSPGRCS